MVIYSFFGHPSSPPSKRLLCQVSIRRRVDVKSLGQVAQTYQFDSALLCSFICCSSSANIALVNLNILKILLQEQKTWINSLLSNALKSSTTVLGNKWVKQSNVADFPLMEAWVSAVSQERLARTQDWRVGCLTASENQPEEKSTHEKWKSLFIPFRLPVYDKAIKKRPRNRCAFITSEGRRMICLCWNDHWSHRSCCWHIQDRTV